MRKIICDPLKSPSVVFVHKDHQDVIFPLLCAWLSAHLLCRVLCLREWSCVLPVVIVIVISWWRSLCGRSCVDIVKIFLCEGGDVEQWLKPRNISLCLRLIYFSQLSLYILHCFICSCSYARYSLCALTCVQPRELLKHLNS